MACQNSTNTQNTTCNCQKTECHTRRNNGYVVIIVLYILLAIILGSFII